MKLALSLVRFLLIYDTLGVFTAWLCGKLRCFFDCDSDESLGVLCIVLWPFILPMAIATVMFKKGAGH